MAGEASELRGYINEQLQAAKHASLVRVIGKYDFYQHAIPTMKQLNRALAGLALVAVRSGDGIILQPNKQTLGLHPLSTDDLSFLYEAYVRSLKKEKRKMHNSLFGPTSGTTRRVFCYFLGGRSTTTRWASAMESL